MSATRVVLIMADDGNLQQIEIWLNIEFPDLELKSFTDPKEGFSYLRSGPDLDQIITSESFSEVGGTVWLNALRKFYPETTLTIIGQNGEQDPAIITFASEDRNAKYLTQPLDIKSLFPDSEMPATSRESNEWDSSPGNLSGDQHQQVAALLADIQENINSHSIYIVDHLGQSLVHLGNAASEHIVEIASLLGGSFAALLEVGNIVDEDESSMNLIYRQGKKDDIYALSVASKYLLILLIAQGPYATRVGTVWYYVREVAPSLAAILENADPASLGQPFGSEMTEMLDKQLDRSLHTATLENRMLPVELQAKDWPFAEEEEKASDAVFAETKISTPVTNELFDLESASELGLIPDDIFERLTSDNEIELTTGELKTE